MARTKAISLIQSGSTKVDLAELSGLVISNIQKDTLSQGLKSQAYTGNPASGSVEFKRFKNSASQPYGTARTAGKGDAITVPPTTVNLNTHKEIVEEAAKFDLDTFGVGNIMARRADNHVDTVASEFDTAFFAQAKAKVLPTRRPATPESKTFWKVSFRLWKASRTIMFAAFPVT